MNFSVHEDTNLIELLFKYLLLKFSNLFKKFLLCSQVTKAHRKFGKEVTFLSHNMQYDVQSQQTKADCLKGCRPAVHLIIMTHTRWWPPRALTMRLRYTATIVRNKRVNALNKYREKY